MINVCAGVNSVPFTKLLARRNVCDVCTYKDCCISQGSQVENQQCMYIYRKNYKEVAYTIKETGKIKIFRDSRLQTWRASSADEV